MSTSDRRVVWVCDARAVAGEVDQLGRLQQSIGLTTVVPVDARYQTSGLRIADDLDRAGPLADWRSRPGLDAHLAAHGLAADDWPVLPGIVGGADDSALCAILDACRRLGLECWGHAGLWGDGGELYPELAMRDVDGRTFDPRYRRWGVGFCPSQPEVTAWLRDSLVDATRRYPLDGWRLARASYPAPANVSSLLGCACPRCQAEARRLGYDFDAMTEALGDLRRRLGSLRARVVDRAAGQPVSPWEVIAWLGGAAAVRWVEFRARLLAERMTHIARAVRAAVDRPVVVGADVLPPSVALLGGQNYPSWASAVDFFAGGASHGDETGWATAGVEAAEQWARFLLDRVSGAHEGAALELMYSVFGLTDLGLPDRLDDLEADPLPVATLYANEIGRLKPESPAAEPVYAPVSADAELDLLGRLCRTVAGSACAGVTLIGLDPTDAGRLAVVRDVFGS